MANVNEIIGKLTLEAICLNEQYDRLLDALRGVITGEIATNRVTVNTGDRSWSVGPVVEEPHGDSGTTGNTDEPELSEPDPDAPEGPDLGNEDVPGPPPIPKGAGENEIA